MSNSTKIRNFLIGTGVVSAAVLMFLISAEFIARTYYDNLTTTSDNNSYFAQRWNKVHAGEMNNWGFRGPEFQPEAVPGITRIAVIGDSFTFGQGIEMKDRLTEQLRDALNKNGNRFEILNFGTPGAETEDHIVTLDKVLSGAHPDFILVQWFVNDVEGHKKRRAEPLRLIPVAWFDAYLKSHSALYFLLNKGWVQLQVQYGGLKSYTDYMRERYEDPQSIPSRKASDEFRTLLALAASRGVPLGAFLYPEIEDVGGDPTRYSHGFLFERTLSQCTESGVHCIDLRPELARIKHTESLWVNEFDHHPNAEVNRIATEAVIAAFGSEWHLPEMGYSAH